MQIQQNCEKQTKSPKINFQINNLNYQVHLRLFENMENYNVNAEPNLRVGIEAKQRRNVAHQRKLEIMFVLLQISVSAVP